MIDDHDLMIENLRIKLRATRLMFYSEVSTVLEDTFLFAIKLADNIGEISYSEAIEGVRICFNEEIDKKLKIEKSLERKEK